MEHECVRAHIQLDFKGATPGSRKLISVGQGLTNLDRLVGLVVKAYASRVEGPGFESRLRRDFFGVESYQ